MIEFLEARKTWTSTDGTTSVALEGLTLRIEAGETHCLIGSSGSGKTTAIKLANRLLEPTSGRVLVGGRDVREVEPIELRRRIGYVMQHGGLFPHMSVARNIAMPGELAGWPAPRRRARAAELLELVRLDPDVFMERAPRELSGGQRQRVGIARALALDPDIVLLDEPFSALDPLTRTDLHEEFRQLERDVQKTMILVTHDLAEAFALGDRVTLMDDGRALQTGTESDLRERPTNDFVARFVATLCVLFGLLMLSAPAHAQGRASEESDLRIGAKSFTESNLLAEIMAQLIEARTDLRVERRLNLAGTNIAWSALLEGEIDLYAEYTGTAWVSLLGRKDDIPSELRTYLEVDRVCRKEFQVDWLLPFGHDNTYALAMREERAIELGIETISDLEGKDGLRAAVSQEFVERSDGWRGLQSAYDLSRIEVSGVEHALAYQLVDNGRADLLDAYSTDGKLLSAGYRALIDDRGFFPPYDAAPIVRQATLAEFPELAPTLELLAFRLGDAEIQGLNAKVEQGADYAIVARDFLVREGLIGTDEVAPQSTGAARGGSFGETWKLQWASGNTQRRLFEHIGLTALAVLLAALIAIPAGIRTSRSPRLRLGLIGSASVFQTIPSLALLALMIQVTDGVTAAVAALVLYSLLPILRNTDTGLRGVDAELIEAGRALGMTEAQILRKVRFPLALPTILAGLRTATVISIGATTLAAFIGAGGLGDAINTGLSLNDGNLVLCGALPAAGLALLADFLLGRLERRLIGHLGAP